MSVVDEGLDVTLFEAGIGVDVAAGGRGDSPHPAGVCRPLWRTPIKRRHVIVGGLAAIVLMPGRWLSAALNSFVGVQFFLLWLARGADYQDAHSALDWFVVVGLSVGLLALALALLRFSRWVSGPAVLPAAKVAAGAAVLGSLVNLFEDGLHFEGFFVFFALSLLTLDIALLWLTVSVARAGNGPARLFALVPAGTLTGILLFPVVGGAIMLVSWLGAAALVLIVPMPVAKVGKLNALDPETGPLPNARR